MVAFPSVVLLFIDCNAMSLPVPQIVTLRFVAELCPGL